MFKKNLSIVLVVSLLAFATMACDSFVKNSYRTLATSAETYNATMSSVARLQDSGVISDETRAEINKVAGIYYDAYQTAVDALELYVKVDSVDNKEKVSVAIAGMTTALAKLLARVEPYLSKPDDNATLLDGYYRMPEVVLLM